MTNGRQHYNRDNHLARVRDLVRRISRSTIPLARARWRHVLESRTNRHPAVRVRFRRQLMREFMAMRQLRQRRMARSHMRRNVLPQLRQYHDNRRTADAVRRYMAENLRWMRRRRDREARLARHWFG